MYVYHLQRILAYVLIAFSLTTISFFIWSVTYNTSSNQKTSKGRRDLQPLAAYNLGTVASKGLDLFDNKNENVVLKNKINYNVHIFYYAWYGNPESDGKYMHWNHPILPSWKEKSSNLPSHEPPEDVAAAFYPQLGAYSSRDAKVVQNHMKQIKAAGVGVVSVSWYPPGQHDDQGIYDHSIMPLILDQAHSMQLKVCLHIEPFKNRSVQTMRQALKYIMNTYANHPAFYRYIDHKSGKRLPLYYIYDSYLMDEQSWSRLLSPVDQELQNEFESVRGTELDGVFVGLLVQEKHMKSLKRCGFDGFYTYFGTDTFTYGSNPKNWAHLAEYAANANMLFIPSVAPGYNDEKVRPWNKINTRQRRNGYYYENSFRHAVASNAPIISITSFNEWHEGTQIEEAVKKEGSAPKYLDYRPNNANHYLVLTNKWVFKFSEKQLLRSSFQNASPNIFQSSR